MLEDSLFLFPLRSRVKGEGWHVGGPAGCVWGFLGHVCRRLHVHAGPLVLQHPGHQERLRGLDLRVQFAPRQTPLQHPVPVQHRWGKSRDPLSPDRVWWVCLSAVMLQRAAAAAPPLPARSGSTWSGMWFYTISWTCGRPAPVRSTITKVRGGFLTYSFNLKHLLHIVHPEVLFHYFYGSSEGSITSANHLTQKHTKDHNKNLKKQKILKTNKHFV